MKSTHTLIISLLVSLNLFGQQPEWVPSVLINVDHYNSVLCHDGVGSAEAFVTGGIGPFEYTWFDFYGNVLGYGLELNNFPAPGQGEQYYFEVRKDTMAEGTGYWWDVLVFNPDSIVIEFDTHVLSSGFNISAPDSSDGQITTNVYGGVPGYSFEWSNGSHSANLSNLLSGTYTVQVTDFTGCTATKSVTLTEPPSPLHVVSITSPDYNNSGFNISKNGVPDGKINLVVNGGTPPYKIRWSPLGETDDKNPDTLWARQYMAEITDASGIAKVTAKITLTEPSKLQLSLTPVNPNCSECSNGSVTTNVTGGVTPYTYQWSSGQTTATITGLPSGEYVVVVTDKNGAQLKEGTFLKGMKVMTGPDMEMLI